MNHSPSHTSHGLVIGKFMPPHRGHDYLICSARQQVDRLTILLFSKRNEPIPGDLRARWLKELYPNLTILHCTDEQRVDYHDPEAWNAWIRSIRRLYPSGPDTVFSSEWYGIELAKRLGARHVMVDCERRQVPVCATWVRERPLAHWQWIAPCVRSYFVKRVCIIGSESTGKTTLAEALARHFETCWVPEYARSYLTANGGHCDQDDLQRIAQGQVASENSLARQANRLLVCDTNLLATMIWSERYWGHVPEQIAQLHEQHRYDLYMLTGLDVPWQADGLRDSPHLRGWMQRRFEQELQRSNAPYIHLNGCHEQRLVQAIRAIESIMSEEVHSLIE